MRPDKQKHITANLAGVLKAEIRRISREEAKAAVKGISKLNVTLKRTAADSKKRLALLEKGNKLLKGLQAKQKAAAPPALPQERKKALLVSKGVRALRKKLGLKRPAFAKLSGTTAQTVYMWETKEGNLKLRPKTKVALFSLRGIGVREAKRRLAEGQ